MSWLVARRFAARTSASKTENSVAAWVSSRHLRRSNHSRFAYQSSASGAGAGSARSFGPMTARSFFVHRRITSRSYVRRSQGTAVTVTERRRAGHPVRGQRGPPD